jgi:hypothetical protein
VSSWQGAMQNGFGSTLPPQENKKANIASKKIFLIVFDFV